MQVFFRAVIPLGILAAGWLGYSLLAVKEENERRQDPEPRLIKTQVITLHRQDYQTVVHTHGVVRPHQEATLTAQVSGKVKSIFPGLEDGAFFKVGEVLLELDDEDFRAEVVSAEAQLARAQAAFSQEEAKAKQARLNWEDLGYEEEPNDLVLRLPQLREAEANVKAAAATLDRARRDLERTQIRAPFDGRVLRRTAAMGESISTGTSLATVYKTDFFEVRLPIAAKELAFLSLPETAEQPPVDVSFFDALNTESVVSWDGKIVGTEGALDIDSRELFVIARIDDPFGLNVPGSGGTPSEESPPLRIGQPVRAVIKGRVLEDVLVVPRDAVRKLNRIYLVKQPESVLQRHDLEWIWSDENNLVVRDETIPDGSLVATSKLVYAPNASKVEILPDVDLANPVPEEETGDSTSVTSKQGATLSAEQPKAVKSGAGTNQIRSA